MTNKPVSRTALSTQVISLPEVATTFQGAKFSTSGEDWKVPDVSRTRNFKFGDISNLVTPEILDELKYVICWYLQNKSGAHSQNLLNNFLLFVRQLPEDSLPLYRISATELLGWKSNLNKRTEWKLGVLGGMFKKWINLGLRGVDPDVEALFNDISLRGNQKGESVRTMDPETGPYTELELQAITSKLNNEFASGGVSTEEYLLVMLQIVFGPRPIQLASLKVKDFTVFQEEDGGAVYTVNVPRAKQRNLPFREQMHLRSLISELGTIMEAHIQELSTRYSDNEIPIPEMALFPNEDNEMPPGLEYHTTAQKLGNRIQAVCNQLSVVSERTGENIHINSRRFRHTLGTRAAEEGHGELIIAELLDHSDTQNVGVYIESTPEMVERIDKATALEMAPIAQAFMGLIVDQEKDARRGDDPSSRIGRPREGHLGTCGKYGFCGAMAPIACYPCRNFQPWLEAPHEELLDALIADRERILEETNDARMATVNDQVIIAVADVVNRCNERKAQKLNREQDNG